MMLAVLTKFDVNYIISVEKLIERYDIVFSKIVLLIKLSFSSKLEGCFVMKAFLSCDSDSRERVISLTVSLFKVVVGYLRCVLCSIFGSTQRGRFHLLGLYTCLSSSEKFLPLIGSSLNIIIDIAVLCCKVDCSFVIKTKSIVELILHL